ncbi:MAG: cation:proton antiporter [Bacteriovoracia bacterium]
MHILDTLALLSGILLVAKLIGGVVNRFGVPAVLAELLTGVIVGNLTFFWPSFAETGLAGLEKSELAHGLSELGVLFLLFNVGLETNLADIGRVGRDATIAAFLGVAAPFALAFATLPFLEGATFNHTLFMAAALTATSVGVTSAVLKEVGQLASRSGQIILGAAVIDDVLGIIVLTVVSGIVATGAVSVGAVSTLLVKTAIFVVAAGLLRAYVFPRVFLRARPFEVSGSLTIFLLAQALLFAWISEKIGLAGIIGAFALGVILDDVHFKDYKAKEGTSLEHIIKPVVDFLSPIFFVVVGMSVKFEAMLKPEAMGLAAILIVTAILGKLACGLALGKQTRKAGGDRWMVGFGMMPRAEVGLIFASIGLSRGILSSVDYAALIAMVALTTFLAPFLIVWRAKQIAPSAKKTA